MFAESSGACGGRGRGSGGRGGAALGAPFEATGTAVPFAERGAPAG
jgi:hypothetical protein